MSKIIPINSLKNTSEISELCHSLNEPVYITKDGLGDMVIMSVETYKDQARRFSIYKDIEISENEFSEGEAIDATEALQEFKIKYEI